MKNFSFRLERVLRLRLEAEQAQARRLAQARAEESTRRLAADAAASRVADMLQQMAVTPTEPRPAGMLSNLMLALEAARARAAAAAGAHREALLEAEREAVAFEQARQARRGLELLRIQRRDHWEAEMGRVEQQQLDEVALRMQRGGSIAG